MRRSLIAAISASLVLVGGLWAAKALLSTNNAGSRVSSTPTFDAGMLKRLDFEPSSQKGALLTQEQAMRIAVRATGGREGQAALHGWCRHRPGDFGACWVVSVEPDAKALLSGPIGSQRKVSQIIAVVDDATGQVDQQVMIPGQVVGRSRSSTRQTTGTTAAA